MKIHEIIYSLSVHYKPVWPFLQWKSKKDILKNIIVPFFMQLQERGTDASSLKKHHNS